MSTLTEELQAIPLFRQLDNEELRELVSLTMVKRLARNEVLCNKGDPAHSMYVLLDGQLRIYELGHDGREVGLNYLVAPAIFGELGVIDDEPRSAHIMSLTASKVAIIPKNVVMQLMTRSPKAALSMFRHLTSMVRRVTANQNLLSLPSVNQRLCAVLLKLSQKQANKPHPVIINPPSQRELSIIVKSSRETISRTITKLMEDNLIQKDGRNLVILRPNVLQSIVDS